MTVLEEIDRLHDRLQKETSFGVCPSDIAFQLLDLVLWFAVAHTEDVQAPIVEERLL